MNPPLLLLIFIGLSAGFLSGVFGIGGGVVIVPALIYLAGLRPQHMHSPRRRSGRERSPHASAYWYRTSNPEPRILNPEP